MIVCTWQYINSSINAFSILCFPAFMSSSRSQGNQVQENCREWSKGLGVNCTTVYFCKIATFVYMVPWPHRYSTTPYVSWTDTPESRDQFTLSLTPTSKPVSWDNYGEPMSERTPDTPSDAWGILWHIKISSMLTEILLYRFLQHMLSYNNKYFVNPCRRSWYWWLELSW